MKGLLTLILGGGRGTRLYPLTKYRSKPAVPFAGKYRLIDIPVSNSLNSGMNRIYVLTQFLSVSLHRHISQTYKFDAFTGGFVEILAAQQTLERSDWYQGTADAVRQNLRYFNQRGVEQILILSGDQLYRMDYRRLLDLHLKSDADATIAVLPVPRAEVSGFGIVKLDEAGRVVEFVEKPQEQRQIESCRTSPDWIAARGIEPAGREHLANMGIYLFRRQVLVELLADTDYADFGKQLFPNCVRSRHVQAMLFDGYWEDVGTIQSFMRANLALTGEQPALQLDSPIYCTYTHARFLPPTRVQGASVRRSLIADGCTIGSGAVIENSVIGLRARIGQNVQIRNSIIMGADYYETDEERHEQQQQRGLPPIGIGDETVIEGAIVDKNCRLGRGVRLVNDGQVQRSLETSHGMVCDGIIVLPKETALPDGWTADFKQVALQ